MWNVGKDTMTDSFMWFLFANICGSSAFRNIGFSEIIISEMKRVLWVSQSIYSSVYSIVLAVCSKYLTTMWSKGPLCYCTFRETLTHFYMILLKTSHLLFDVFTTKCFCVLDGTRSSMVVSRISTIVEIWSVFCNGCNEKLHGSVMSKYYRQPFCYIAVIWGFRVTDDDVSLEQSFSMAKHKGNPQWTIFELMFVFYFCILLDEQISLFVVDIPIILMFLGCYEKLLLSSWNIY